MNGIENTDEKFLVAGATEQTRANDVLTTQMNELTEKLQDIPVQSHAKVQVFDPKGKNDMSAHWQQLKSAAATTLPPASQAVSTSPTKAQLVADAERRRKEGQANFQQNVLDLKLLQQERLQEASASEAAARPQEPKMPMPAYYQWCVDNRAAAVQAVGTADLRQVTNQLGKMWRDTTPKAIKRYYENKAEEDMMKYRDSMQKYRDFHDAEPPCRICGKDCVCSRM